MNDPLVFLSADLMQAEAVVVAHLCGDQHLIDVMNDPNGDVHKMTASMMLGIPEADIGDDSHERAMGKKLRHASSYVMGISGLVEELGIARGEAKRLMALFYQANPFLEAWHKRVKAELNESMTLVTPLGWRRLFIERWGDNLFRSAISFIPQGTVGQIMNEGLCDFYDKYGTEVAISFQVHDDMTIQCPKSKVDLWKPRMAECLEREVTVTPENTALRESTFKIGVDFKVGETWKGVGDDD